MLPALDRLSLRTGAWLVTTEPLPDAADPPCGSDQPSAVGHKRARAERARAERAPCVCSICLEAIETDALYLYCSREKGSDKVSHTFHSACLKLLAKKTAGGFQCPLCRRPVVETGVARTVAAGEGAQWVLAHPVRRVRPDGLVSHYVREEGIERLVRDERRDGVVLHYDGGPGEERRVRARLPSGQVIYYDGESGSERVVRVERDRETWYYEGGRGNERIVRVVQPNGVVRLYEGGPGNEMYVRTLYPSM